MISILWLKCCLNSIAGFTVVEADKPEGPYRILENQLVDMDEQWAPWVFVDDDGKKYLVCSFWIQELSPDGLSFAGPRTIVAKGFLENPWLIKKDGFYYWFCSENGADTWGMLMDKSKVSVWRSPTVLGPYEKCPHSLIRANVKFQAPNSGSAVFGPDHRWWYLYNTFQVDRITLCRQLHLDRMDWDADGWPVVNRHQGPGLTYPKPVQGYSPRWLPDLNDEFDQPLLEGINGGVLGRKWLFKREDPTCWSLTDRPGFLRLRVAFPSIDDPSPYNAVVQRPTSAYYAIETCMEFLPLAENQQAGLLVQEFRTVCGVAIGFEQTNRKWLKVWHNHGDGMKEIAGMRCDDRRIYLRIVVEGLVFYCFYSLDNVQWNALGPGYYYAFRGQYFGTFHPGLFAGEKVDTKSVCYADFDYFHHQDLE